MEPARSSLPTAPAQLAPGGREGLHRERRQEQWVPLEFRARPAEYGLHTCSVGPSARLVTSPRALLLPEQERRVGSAFLELLTVVSNDPSVLPCSGVAKASRIY